MMVDVAVARVVALAVVGSGGQHGIGGFRLCFSLLFMKAKGQEGEVELDGAMGAAEDRSWQQDGE